MSSYNQNHRRQLPQPQQYNSCHWIEERRYADRIAALMDTDRITLNNYAKIKLWEDGPNYQKVVKYVNNSQCHENVKLTVINIHRVWRRGDPKGFFGQKNRMLLWHGTKRNNIPRILDTGFKVPPSAGQMFGAGIYFADRITKSSNYSDSDATFLLLCEVGLGRIYSCRECHNSWTSAPAGFNSVKANGTFVPDWNDKGQYIGCLIPFGKTARCSKYPSHAVNYNEFIVYDPKRIIIRFLVEVKVERTVSPMTPVTPRSAVPPAYSSVQSQAKLKYVTGGSIASTTQYRSPIANQKSVQSVHNPPTQSNSNSSCAIL